MQRGHSKATGTTGQPPPPDLAEGPTHRLRENGEEEKEESGKEQQERRRRSQRSICSAKWLFCCQKLAPNSVHWNSRANPPLPHPPPCHHLPHHKADCTHLDTRTPLPFPAPARSLPCLSLPWGPSPFLRMYLNPPARVETCPSISGCKALLLQAPGEAQAPPPPSGPRGRHGQSWASKQGAHTSTLKPLKPGPKALEAGFN